MIRRSLRYAEELSEAVQKQLALAYTAKDLIAFGLRSRLREGYTARDFRAFGHSAGMKKDANRSRRYRSKDDLL